MLKILVLGPPVIQDDDKPLKIPRRQARTLLFYLACQPDGVSRGEIVSRLWKDASEADARRSLREILSKVRNEIPDPDAIQSDQDRLWLDHEKAYSDFHEFMSLIQPAQSFFGISHRQNSLPEKIVEKLELAVSIWRSPFLLAGLGIRSTNAFDDWLQSKSNSLEYYRLQCLERLADHFSSAGDLDKAILYLNKALESDPLDEHLQEYLLGVLYKAGRFNEAQSYYKFLKDLYQRELEEVPPEILKLAVYESSQPIKIRPPRGLTVRNATGRFIGRVNELDQLERCYTKGGVAIVLGEVGSGKSHFVHQFCSSLIEKPKTIFVTCHEEETSQPMQAIINMLRDNFTYEDFEKLDAHWRNLLSILLPGLIRKNSSLLAPEDTSPEENRQNLFEAIFQLLLKTGKGKRTVLVIDDIQWVDQDSIEVLMYLVNEGYFQKYGFLILVSRLEIVNMKIRYLLMEDEKHNSIPRINIGPLTQQETGLLSRQIFGWDPDLEFVQKLHRSTGGNPLLIRETLYSILDTEEDRSSINDNTIRFPENLSSIIEEKEEILDTTSRDVLSASAICGMEFQFDILEYLNICGKEELVRVLEDLEAKQFIHSHKSMETAGKYTFNHSFFRDLLVARLSPARLCYLNEQVALAKIKLRGSQSKRQASVIARHFEMAGKPLQAFEYWIKAAQYARELYSKEEAYNAFSKANQIRLEFAESISEENLYLLYSEWGDMAYNQMDLASFEECYSAMHEAGEQINSQLLIGAGLSGLGLSAVLKVDLDKGLFLLEQAIQILDQTDNLLEKIQGNFRSGSALAMAGKNLEAIELLNQAIKLAKGVSSQNVRQLLSLVQSYSSLLHSIIGQPIKAIEIGKAALQNSYLLISKSSIQAGAYEILAVAEYYTGNFSESMNHVRRAKKLVENLQNPRITSLMLILESRLNTLLARMDSGWDLACSALDMAIKNNFIENISEAYCVRGDVFLTLHIYDKAIQEYKNGYDTMPGTHSGLDNLYRLGFATAMNGDFDQGLQIIRTAIDQADQMQLGSITIPARYLSAQLLELSGNVDEAKLIFDSVIPEAEKWNFSLVTIPGSIPRLKYLWDNVDNPLVYQVIQNLCDRGIIPQDGIWKEKLIANVARHQLYSRQFDFDRLARFLDGLKMNSGS